MTIATSPDPFRIGPFTIDPPLALAPMSGYSHRAFRSIILDQGGCGLLYTEFVSSNILHNERRNFQRTIARFDWIPEENPIAVQVYGHKPALIAEAARVVAEHGAPIVDINFGCWVPKVSKIGAGAAMLREPTEALRTIAAVMEAVKVPVTIKLRAGWDAEHITAIEIAREAAAMGVAAIALHPRTAAQAYRGQSDWSLIRQMKEAVTSVPIIGNGDVRKPEDAIRMFRETGCDGVMIGRAALGAPWIFRQTAAALRGDAIPPEPTLPEKAAIMLEHARRFSATTAGIYSAPTQARELRGALGRYATPPEMRARLVRVTSLDEVEAILGPVIEGKA